MIEEGEVQVHRTFWKQRKLEKRKIRKLRFKVRRAWIKANPPNHQGYYTCGICRRQVHESEMELDHILPSSSRPELIDDPNNLQPTHSICNRLKGSKHG
ncbi:MAG: hypothetical protein EPO02_13535 [Nitrospirae bacterium]|nr:MAG: hypothetical protein EPO02_13535 [Nitrospirota bacterium]